MTNIVNSLSVKLELGGPMINLYLSNNPDHYCSHEFGHLYWKAFVTTSRGLIDKPSKVAVFKQGKKIIGLSPVMDYVWRPRELESLNLYDWISNCV
ncbi:hypothetical protein L208DRAFT_1286360 [Tricholoma matsutake]|nr:hypothetical protein L208DRAFT_1286360 [Tricholoma matsutake 945]